MKVLTIHPYSLYINILLCIGQHIVAESSLFSVAIHLSPPGSYVLRCIAGLLWLLLISSREGVFVLQQLQTVQ